MTATRTCVHFSLYLPQASRDARDDKFVVTRSLYADVRPSFVVDITPFIEERFRALLAYRSQYTDQPSGGSLFVPHDEIRERTFALARHYGLLGGVRYAEPFVQKEVGLVDDLTLVPVSSI